MSTADRRTRKRDVESDGSETAVESGCGVTAEATGTVGGIVPGDHSTDAMGFPQ